MTYARFTVAYWCLLVAALLPFACAALAKWGMFGVSARLGGYDNHNPRAWLARQTDWRARANSAQANTFEALPFFFAAVIIAHQLQASQVRLDVFAFVFVVLRMAYVIMYVADMAKSRSVLWFLALLVNVGILFLGYR
ncbi:MAG: MAPEG family protein [Polaromonas sp.]|uniref:MAPEG family protein n=1 Tax=Polaromonas sp. TaxID=1869339 RepID=UPI00273087CB|nr:MAPEG family protein [Polaromonas sp.]MDP1740880.1 MAPEG family protein [Polaromonas sp.]MDP1953804.1 MAPEG family protein [Polaromonas sp.]MDP3357215.1 MAPEG family protein [Polaromonas sp.]MDP3750563.1 MAPEG family protein [Polaromonas sp.]